MDRVDQLEAHRVALTGHCYRMLGSAVDAEDAVQETLIRAWRGLDSFDGRASLKNWLYRISTNVCLDALAARKRHRARPVEDGPREHPGMISANIPVSIGSNRWPMLARFPLT